jgi:hypothetical protein
LSLILFFAEEFLTDPPGIDLPTPLDIDAHATTLEIDGNVKTMQIDGDLELVLDGV